MTFQFTSCNHIQKQKRGVVKDEASLDLNVLPLYEENIFIYNIKRNNSLQTNELLKCRWNEYKDSFSQKIMAPFAIPDKRIEHFYMNQCRIAPSQTVNKKLDFRYKIGAGPGVDHLGNQKPIPNEALILRERALDIKKCQTNK